MVRLLAEVVRRKRKKEVRKIKNFECEILSIKVRIKGPARKSYRIPVGIRGKTFTIERTFLRDWTIKKGDYIILNQDESRRCIEALGKGVEERKWKDFIKKDIDGDGYYEIVFDNPFIKAVISPHYGARLWQLWNKGTESNELYGGSFFQDKGYIELGGIEETLSQQGKPDELWNGFFKSERCKEKNVISFYYKMKEERELVVRKRFMFYKEFPGLLETINFTFKPEKEKGKKKKGKKKKKKSIKLTQRIFFAMGGIPDYNNLYWIPTKDELNYVRFNKPLFKRGWDGDIWWDWTHLHFSPDPGLIILEREGSDDVLLLFFNRDDIDFVWTGDKKRTPRLYIFYKENKIEAKKGKEYKTLFATANRFSFRKKEILFASRGKIKGDYVPLSFIYYTKSKKKNQSIAISRGGDIEMCEMKKFDKPGIPGSFFYFTTVENKDSKEVSGTLKGKDLRVRLRLE